MLKTRPYFLKAAQKAAAQQAVGGEFIFFLLLHFPLALLMRQSEMVATVHALVTLGLGSIWALQGKQERVILTLGYIAGAEVLWRMTDANVFWEYGKYATVFIVLVSIFKGRKLNPPKGILLYFLLLLPSIALSLTEKPFDQAREGISFNLSGPLAVFVCAWYFDGKEIDLLRFKKIVWVVVAPLVGIVTIAWISIVTTGDIVFSTESNFQTSGGYGPNQVSGILGMGIFLIFMTLLMGQEKITHRLVLFGLFFGFIIEVFLTFSRTGAYLTAASTLGATLLWFRTGKDRTRIVFIFVILLLTSVYLIFPYLESFTKGYFSERFTDTSLTGRDSIFIVDLKIWQEHFYFGVGPGLAVDYRSEFYDRAAAHTEYSRMLAEHGLFGFFSLGVFFLATFSRVMREISTKSGAFKLGSWIFVLLFMAASALRLVAPAFMLGLIFASLKLQSNNYPVSRKSNRRRLA